MRLTRLLLVLLILVLSSLTQAWEQTGHMLVAQIAYDNLDQAILNQITNYIDIYKDFYPKLSDMLSVAVWADMIRADHIYAFANWHFIDSGYSPDNTNYPAPDAQNILFALSQAMLTLNHSPDQWGAGFMIRMLIHLLGDLHQPFHNIVYYSSSFPRGDRGGNSYLVYVNTTQTNLHSFWDSIGGTGKKSYVFPLTDQEISNIQTRAKEIQVKYPNNQAFTLDIKAWSQESHDLAISQGYAGVALNSKLTTNYIANTIQVCESQIAKAGYRLAGVLKQIFNTSHKNYL